MSRKFFTLSTLTVFSCGVLAAVLLGADKLSKPAIAHPHDSGQLLESPAPGTYQVPVRHSNKCLHQHGGIQDNGGDVTQWDCINQDNVKVEVEPVKRFEVGGQTHFSPYFLLKFKHSGKCVYLPADATHNGAHITQQDCDVNSPEFQWFQVSASDGYVYIVNAATGKCMHQQGTYIQDNGGDITQWTCVNQTNVQWKFLPSS